MAIKTTVVPPEDRKFALTFCQLKPEDVVESENGNVFLVIKENVQSDVVPAFRGNRLLNLSSYIMATPLAHSNNKFRYVKSSALTVEK